MRSILTRATNCEIEISSWYVREICAFLDVAHLIYLCVILFIAILLNYQEIFCFILFSSHHMYVIFSPCSNYNAVTQKLQKLSSNTLNSHQSQKSSYKLTSQLILSKFREEEKEVRWYVRNSVHSCQDYIYMCVCVADASK